MVEGHTSRKPPHRACGEGVSGAAGVPERRRERRLEAAQKRLAVAIDGALGPEGDDHRADAARLHERLQRLQTAFVRQALPIVPGQPPGLDMIANKTIQLSKQILMLHDDLEVAGQAVDRLPMPAGQFDAAAGDRLRQIDGQHDAIRVPHQLLPALLERALQRVKPGLLRDAAPYVTGFVHDREPHAHASLRDGEIGRVDAGIGQPADDLGAEGALVDGGDEPRRRAQRSQVVGDVAADAAVDETHVADVFAVRVVGAVREAFDIDKDVADNGKIR